MGRTGDTALARREGSLSLFSVSAVGVSATEVREARWGGGGVRLGEWMSRSH